MPLTDTNINPGQHNNSKKDSIHMIPIRSSTDIDERMWIVPHAAYYIILPLFCPLQ